MAKLNETIRKKDEQLFAEVRKLQANASGDYNRLYELSQKYIYKIIYDIVKDPYTTEDLMQETYLQIYNKIGTLEAPEAFHVWAGRIATNLTLRYIQKMRHEVLVHADDEGSTDFVFEQAAEDTEAFIPEAVLMDREKQRLIGEILDNLSTEQKLCVQFFYFEEMSVKEIAQAMQCSGGTVKSRLSYARKQIKEVVLDMEVKQGTRLYALSSLPLLFLVFRAVAEKMTIVPVGASLAAASGSGAAGAGSAAATGASATGGAASASAAGAAATGGATSASAAGAGVSGAAAGSVKAAGGGFLANIFGTTAGKIAVGGVAAALITTGVVVGITQANRSAPEPEPVAVAEVSAAPEEPVAEEVVQEEEEIDDSLVVFADSYIEIEFSFQGNYDNYPVPANRSCYAHLNLPASLDKETEGLIEVYPGGARGYLEHELDEFADKYFPDEKASAFFVAHEAEATRNLMDEKGSLHAHAGYPDEYPYPYAEMSISGLPDSVTFVYEGVEYTFHIESAMAGIRCDMKQQGYVSQYVHSTVIDADEYRESENVTFENMSFYASSADYVLYGYATCEKEALIASNGITEEDVTQLQERKQKYNEGRDYAFYAPPGGFAYLTGEFGERSGAGDGRIYFEWVNDTQVSHPDLIRTEIINGREEEVLEHDPGWVLLAYGDYAWSSAGIDDYSYGEGFYFVYNTGLREFVYIKYHRGFGTLPGMDRATVDDMDVLYDNRVR